MGMHQLVQIRSGVGADCEYVKGEQNPRFRLSLEVIWNLSPLFTSESKKFLTVKNLVIREC